MIKLKAILVFALLGFAGASLCVYGVENVALAEVIGPEKSVDAGSFVETPVKFSEIVGLQIAEKTLANGLKVVAVRQAGAPKVIVELVFRGVGSSIEQPGEKGIAHLIEHMIFKGTKELPEGGFDMVCNKYGAFNNAFTGFDLTAYYVVAGVNNWKPFLHLYADCMQNTLFDLQHLASEVKVVVKELRRDEDSPGWVMPQAFIRELVPVEHPHHGFMIGYKKDLADVTGEKLKAFFDKYYRPETATLFVVGDIDLNDAIMSAEAEFSSVQAALVELPKPFEKKHDLNFGFHKVLYDESTADRVMLAWPIPGGVHAESYQAEVLAAALTSGNNGLLIKRLVNEEKCAQSVSAWPWILSGQSYFAINCNPLIGQTEKCVQLIYEELSKLAETGFDASMLRRIVQMERLKHAIDLQGLTNTSSGINQDWIYRYIQTDRLETCFNHVENFDLVTPELLQKFVATYLSKERSGRVDMIPLSEIEREKRVITLQNEQELEEKIFAAHVRTTPVVEAVLPDLYSAAKPIVVSLPKPDVELALDNGLRVLVSKDTSSDLCVFNLEHRDREHFEDSLDTYVLSVLSSMLMEGSFGASREEITSWFEEHGASVSLNGTSWSLVSLKENFIPALEYLFKIIFSAQFSSEDLEKVKNQMIVGCKHQKDDSWSIACRTMFQRLYPKTVRDWSYDDLIARIESLDVATLREYMARYVDPKAMVASIVGNVDSSDALVALNNVACLWTSNGYQVEPFSSVKPLLGNVDIPVMRDQVWMVYARPASITMMDPDFPAIFAANEILFGYGRLWALREQTGLFYMLSGSFSTGTGLLPGRDRIVTQTGPELLSLAYECFDRFLAQDVLKPVTQEELDRAKALIRVEVAAQAVGASEKAGYFADLACKQLDIDFYDRLLLAIDVLTPEVVTAAVARYLVAGGEYVRIQVGNIPG